MENNNLSETLHPVYGVKVRMQSHDGTIRKGWLLAKKRNFLTKKQWQAFAEADVQAVIVALYAEWDWKYSIQHEIVKTGDEL